MAKFDALEGTPLEERLPLALKSAGAAIFFTTSTDFVAFSCSALMGLPAIRHFGVICAIAVLFDLILQVTFFGAVLAIDARRQQLGAVSNLFLN